MTERRCEIGLAAKIFCVEGVSISLWDLLKILDYYLIPAGTP